MASKRARGDRLLETALAALASALTDSGAPWMIIGGIAVIAHGVQRFTTDIDAVVRGDAIGVDSLISVLRQHGIAPRIEDAAGFARANLVLLMRHTSTGVDLDVSFAWSAFEHEALEARTEQAFGRVRVLMTTATDLLVFKAIAGRAKDIEDAEALLVLYPSLDVVHARKRLSELAALAEAPELVIGFDAVIARARGPRAAPGRRRKKT